MPFRNPFRKSGEEPDDEPPEEIAEDSEDAEDEAGGDALEGDDDDAPAEVMDETAWRERALAVLPTGASTGSKRPSSLYGADADDAPTHFVRASGCLLTTTDDETIIDCTMALGAVAIGYADETITRNVIEAAATGHVGGLSDVREIFVAERLCDFVPCAEQAIFLKSGAEAVSAAVRLARTYTGRDRVVGSGYFGWHDWWTQGRGIPAAVGALYTPVPFDDIGALQRAVDAAGDDLAAVILEPVVERLPSEEWMREARRLADARGAVLIFDEMKTGFRLRPGGYQEFSGIEPDLATFGKALANGYPLAAVVGRADVMGAARDTWISSTLASEGTALAAANAVMDYHEAQDVCAVLWETGRRIRDAVTRALEASGLPGVTVQGIDPMWFLRFEDAALESRFLVAAVRHGVLFKRGAYNFAALAHDDEDILIDIERGASEAFVALREEAGSR